MKIGIIGAGPSGLTASIAIKRKHPDWDIKIFEQMNKCGKKLLASGNGKGNISNTNMNTSFYNTNKIEEILKKDVDEFFNSIGLLTRVDKEGRVYPYNENSSSVLDCLRLEMNELKIEVVMEKVIDVQYNMVVTNFDSYYCDKIIIATGGKSSEFLGSDGKMFRILKGFGHTIIEPKPALCPIVSKESFKDIAGLRCKVIAAAYNGEEYFEDTGELLFKEDGVSGIVIFQISSFFARGKHGYIKLDFFPDYEQKDLEEIINKLDKNKYIDLAFMGMINRKLLNHIIGDSRGKKLSEYNFGELAYKLKNYKIECVKNYPFIQSQITVGGVSLKEVKENLESKLVDNLYFVGEVLDVDGLSGGYNLHFAFASALHLGETI